MGLLYGRGDPNETIIIATRCGQDSDCNPSSAAGILFTTIGFEKLPERFKTALDPTGKFSHTPYDFPTLGQRLGEAGPRGRRQLRRQDCGGQQGKEYFAIPRYRPHPTPWSSAGTPRPASGSRYTAAGDGPDHGRKWQGPVQGHREIRSRLEDQPVRRGHESRSAAGDTRPRERSGDAPAAREVSHAS